MTALSEAWGRFAAEVTAIGREACPTFFDVYVTEPTPTIDPAVLRTDLIVFLN